MARIVSIVTATALLALSLVSTPAVAQDEWVVRTTSQGVEATVRKLEEAIERSGSQVLATFDHAAAAADIGQQLEPTVVVVFARPKASSPLIAANRRLAIDMPQKILVWEEEGDTHIGYVAPASLIARHGLQSGRPELESLRVSMDALVSAVLSRSERRTARR